MQNSQRVRPFVSLLVILSMLSSSLALVLGTSAGPVAAESILLQDSSVLAPELNPAPFATSSPPLRPYLPSRLRDMDTAPQVSEARVSPDVSIIDHASWTVMNEETDSTPAAGAVGTGKSPPAMASDSSATIQPSQAVTSSRGLSSTVIFLPLIYSNAGNNDDDGSPQGELPGLTLTPPQGWQPPVATDVPVAATNAVADAAMMRLISPDGIYHFDVIVDWSTPPPPKAVFGNFAMPPGDSRYQESVRRLSTSELAQVMHATDTVSGSMSLLAHAAFRSDRASYSLGLYGEALNEGIRNVFSDTLASVATNSATLPEASQLAENGEQAASDVETSSQSPIAVQQFVSYDRDAAVRYTNTYVNIFDNSDDCYLWYNGSSLRCNYLEGYWGVDGAHFVNRALSAGGLPIPGLWDGIALRSRELRDWLLANGGHEINDPSNLKKGDVIFYGRDGCWGWAGVVIDQNVPRPRVQLHAHVTLGGITYPGLTIYYDQVVRDECGETNRHSYVHIATLQDQPGPLIAQSLTRSPATPFAGQPVQATFRVCNYGGATFDTDQLYVHTSSPGSNFPTVDPPPLAPGNPGGCYDYNQTSAVFPSSGWYAIRAGYSDGGFQTLDTIAGQVNEQTVYIASPDDIQLQGDMVVNPSEARQGEPVSVQFTVRNTGSGMVTDQFRVRIYDETYPAPNSLVAEFPASGDVALAPDETYTYNDSLVLDTPGIYWAVGEHWAGGDWQPVYGDSIKLLRVRYPMPPKPKLAKGMPPYIALAGEPVNTGTGNFVHEHTDLVIPLPGISFDVTRYYNHMDADEILGPFGHGWTWSLGWHVDWRDDKSAVLTYPDGRESYFLGELDPDDPFGQAGEYVGQFAETQTLVRTEDGTAILEGSDQLRYEFGVEGCLARVRDGAENGFDITWDVAGHIEQIVHTSGAVYEFVYTGDYITSITSPDGYSLNYTYSSGGDLLRAASTAGDTMAYTYDEHHRMLTIEDALDQRFLLNEYDAQNRVLAQSDSSGVRSTFSYPSERVAMFTDQLGVPVTHIYDEELRVARIEDARGGVTTYGYDEDYNRIEKVDPMGGVWRWAYDAHARVISSTNPLGANWLYTYDERGNLIKERNPLGHVKEYVYDEHNNLIREVDAEGGETVRDYDDRGLVIRETDPTGAITEYKYNTMGLVVEIKDSQGVTTIEYDVYGNRTSYTDAEGRTTTATFDDASRMLSTTGPLGNVIEFTHDDNGNLLSESDGEGHVRTFEYDEQDRLIKRTDFAGNVWTFEYDDLGRSIREEDPLGLIVEADPLGNETRYEYDAAGQRVAVGRPCETCPGGRALERTEYDLAGQVIARTDGRGYTAHYRYDRVGRRVEEIDALGYSTRYVYNARGDLVQIIDALGNVTYREYNPAGWLIKETDRLGYDTVLDYDGVGNLLSVRDARGNVTRYEYDSADRLVREIDTLNNVTSYKYDTRGNLLTKTDALGHVTTYAYDANNNLTSVTNPRGYTTTYEYDALGRKVKMIDALGGVTTYAYNAAGDLLSETDPAGCTRQMTYDLLGRRIEETDRNGNTTTFEYDAAGNLVHITDPLGGVTTRTFDANRNELTETNALGHTTTYHYDALNRQVQVLDPLGGVSTHTYDTLGHLEEVIDANSRATHHTYDAEGRRTSTVDALGHTTQYEYDGNGNLTRVVDRNGHVTLYTYDALNRQVALTNGLGHTSTTRYDAVGNSIEQVNFRGYATRFEYGANDNLVREMDALGGVTAYRYDALDRQVAVTDANGHTKAYTYDAVGNLLTITLPEGQVTHYGYDCERNRLSFTNAKGYTTIYAYDTLNRQVSETDPLGHVTRTEYDAIGQKTRVIDAEGNANRFAHDALGRLVSVTDALGYTTQYTYDPVGNLLTETDANGHITTHAYDALNRLVSETNPLGHTWAYAYDPEGNLTQQVDANRQVISSEFDAVNQLIAIHYPDSSQDVTYEYDPNGNLIHMVDAIGTTALSYDPLDREVSKADPYGQTLENDYDPVGNRLSITYPGSDRATYRYDANDWLVQMTDPDGGVTTYSYDPDGLPTHTGFPNGTWTDQVYDRAGRLVGKFNGTTHNTGLVTAYDYTLDAVGNRLQTIERYTSGQIRTIVKTYRYNARYELLEAVEEYEGAPSYTVVTSYTYDPIGNRLSMATNRDVGPGPRPNSETIHYTYDAANRMLSAGDVTYTYDANGNRLTKVTSGTPTAQGRLETYEYDFENRLTLYTRTQSRQVEQRVYNVYDGLGRRLNKGTQEAEGTTKWVQYALDGLGYDQLAEYPQAGGPRVTQFYRGRGNQLVSMDEIQGGGPGSRYWFAADGLGSVAATTKQNGQSTHEYFYDPYGQIIDENGHWEDSSSWTNPHNHYLLTGKEWDEESRLYYFGARFYDAEASSWLTQDPYRGGINSPMTRHRYLYVRNNPVNRIDPLGLFDWQTGMVEWGDTWESIATQWGSSVAELKRLNPWISVPKVGDYLQLPDCRSAQCQMQLGINQVRIAGVNGTMCGQRLIQQQKAYQAWLMEQRRIGELQRWIQVLQQAIQEGSNQLTSELSEIIAITICELNQIVLDKSIQDLWDSELVKKWGKFPIEQIAEEGIEEVLRLMEQRGTKFLFEDVGDQLALRITELNGLGRFGKRGLTALPFVVMAYNTINQWNEDEGKPLLERIYRSSLTFGVSSATSAIGSGNLPLGIAADALWEGSKENVFNFLETDAGYAFGTWTLNTTGVFGLSLDMYKYSVIRDSGWSRAQSIDLAFFGAANGNGPATWMVNGGAESVVNALDENEGIIGDIWDVYVDVAEVTWLDDIGKGVQGWLSD
jgi:RHS repeat-associated protein